MLAKQKKNSYNAQTSFNENFVFILFFYAFIHLLLFRLTNIHVEAIVPIKILKILY